MFLANDDCHICKRILCSFDGIIMIVRHAHTWVLKDFLDYRSPLLKFASNKNSAFFLVIWSYYKAQQMYKIR